ncbi:MAG: ShlB/FhaC/HecB family hemolysin secretion/activation protein [Selenomonadaceae bacterium]|nr:ShlB/FhaC/HecB family hemolysin secretion/activation protein [Selenomonadaceae bacterium]MBQ2410898.1 ShlB/FhaC/HecB family hemolysin secretion/activation protein [Selenomonadaceae bacterium]MBQ5586648.1 ShlB/FhaC/HecB family hemolysin secretion/activation protein [Selenomonadaceae bacterium]MBQ5733713.1 ShlB/FhaC/HecB family hemolysin secretion/activation protein [Selenomonadaceae bacterium]
MKLSKKRVVAASLLAVSVAGAAGMDCQAEAADLAKNQLQTNQAREDLRRDVTVIQERTQQEAKPVDLRDLRVTVNKVIFQQNDSISENNLRCLLPALKKDKVNIYLLSKEIQLANDNCGVKLNADFRRAGADSYDVYVSVVPQKQEFASITIANNGTGYDTGEWRATASYVDKNVTGNGDTLGVAYVTAPGHWDNVQQAAASYRWLLPSAHDTVTFTASYSKVDLGNVMNSNMPFDLTANGKGTAVGLHYQHNLKYAANQKDFIDFGFDYKKYDSDYSILGTSLDAPDYNVKVLSATYVHSERQANQAFTWHGGIATNVGGINDEYLRNDGSDSHFNLLKAGMNYQYRTEDDWIVGVRANAQYSSNKVVSSERFGLGGQSSIRGFNERIISGDKGVSGSLEFMSPQIIKNGRMYIFTDMGQISSNQNNSSSRNLSSAGIGFRFSDPVNFWSIDLSYAKILQGFDENNEPNNAYKRWNLMATKTF